MRERAFVLIFFFWAVLTIITPTLIRLSENSKPNLDSNGEKSELMRARRMMGYIEKYPRETPISLPPMEAPPSQAPVPALKPATNPVLEARKAILKIFSKEQLHR